MLSEPYTQKSDGGLGRAPGKQTGGGAEGGASEHGTGSLGGPGPGSPQHDGGGVTGGAGEAGPGDQVEPAERKEGPPGPSLCARLVLPHSLGFEPWQEQKKGKREEEVKLVQVVDH